LTRRLCRKSSDLCRRKVGTNRPDLNPGSVALELYMSWGQFAQHAAVALIVAIVTAVGAYVLIRFLLFDL